MALIQSAVRDVIPDVGVHFNMDENVLKGLSSIRPFTLPSANDSIQNFPRDREYWTRSAAALPHGHEPLES